MVRYWFVASIAGYGECAFASDRESPFFDGHVKGDNLTKIFAHPQGAFAFVRAKDGEFDFPATAVSAWMPLTEPQWIEGLGKCWSAIALR